jgi:hypothetical protein
VAVTECLVAEEGCTLSQDDRAPLLSSRAALVGRFEALCKELFGSRHTLSRPDRQVSPTTRLFMSPCPVSPYHKHFASRTSCFVVESDTLNSCRKQSKSVKLSANQSLDDHQVSPLLRLSSCLDHVHADAVPWELLSAAPGLLATSCGHRCRVVDHDKRSKVGCSTWETSLLHT